MMGTDFRLLDAKAFLRLEHKLEAPDYAVEEKLHLLGARHICGTDEAGRGPLAGPVVAAAVILQRHEIPDGLNDSKKLTDAARSNLFEEICKRATVAVSVQSAETIDLLNIRAASLLAMKTSIQRLTDRSDAVLVDGNAVPAGLPVPAFAMIKGDGRSVSIAAASIVAKTLRDRIMLEAHQHWPEYDFAKHKGYPTPMHLEALKRYGPCPLHRQSFRPVQLARMAVGAAST
jgi:ribonuclease HII